MANYTKGKAQKLSYHFKSTEFDCRGAGCCSRTVIDEELVVYLERVRNHFNKPVVINSGYRCSKHNKAVNGATLSKHRFGMAADIVVKGVKPQEVAKYCESIGVLGIGLYDSFTHIDTRRTKAFWYSAKEIKRTTFGASKSNRVIAEEVIDGKWGVGSARKKALTAAGYDYKEIQALVNELLRK